jgi:prepilin-type N-terminal cleavage/methylation domain-containing protein
MTLIELLVVMVIFSVLLSIVYGVLISVQRQTAATAARADSADQARLAMAQIDRQVRSGNVLYDPVYEPLPMSMRIYTQANGQQRCVQWQVTAGVLRTRWWEQTNPAGASAWQIVARNLVNDGSNPPFALQGSSTVYGARLVDVLLLVKSPGASGPPVEIRSSLSGRNTSYGYDPGVCSPVPPI